VLLLLFSNARLQITVIHCIIHTAAFSFDLFGERELVSLGTEDKPDGTNIQ